MIYAAELDFKMAQAMILGSKPMDADVSAEAAVSPGETTAKKTLAIAR
jgi:hypothetical protein